MITDDYRILEVENKRLEQALLYLAECCASTAEHDGSLASCSKSRRERYNSICDKAARFIEGEHLNYHKRCRNPEKLVARLKKIAAGK